MRRYVKQGGDFCKELASILHERYLDIFFRSFVIYTSESFIIFTGEKCENLCFRAELEATYAKGLSKLSSKLTKACAKDQGDYRFFSIEFLSTITIAHVRLAFGQ